MAAISAERERNMRRDHERRHPSGLLRSGAPCEACLLLETLREERTLRPRCEATTPRGYRCARPYGHGGRHGHPCDPMFLRTPLEDAALTTATAFKQSPPNPGLFDGEAGERVDG